MPDSQREQQSRSSGGEQQRKDDGARKDDESRNDEDRSAPHVPDLDEREEKMAEEYAAANAPTLHEVVRLEGESELGRTSSALAWSGLAAGLSMGFSFIAEGLLRAHLPDEPWRPLVAKLGYTVGFVIVILGRQQLFTENTLTPIIPLLSRRDFDTFRQVLRLWGVVLASNLAGTALVAVILGGTGLFEPEVRRAFDEISREAMQWNFGMTVLKGIFAGWLIALLVWVLGGVRDAKLGIIVVITWVVAIGSFSHVVVGSIEAFYRAVTGVIGWDEAFGRLIVPALIGNVLGGVSLVAALNHGQVVAGGGKE